MIESSEVIAFFDRLAPSWDADMIRDDEIISEILDRAGVSAGKDVLDVACGTGVLIPDYLARNVNSVTGIDISPKMAAIARAKFAQPSVAIYCGDIETQPFERLFDCIMVYNAFPHFPDPERLIRRLAGLLAPGGILSIAHGMSREKINAHHSGAASHVSNGLLPAEELAGIMGSYLTVTVCLSDERFYQVCALRR